MENNHENDYLEHEVIVASIITKVREGLTLSEGERLVLEDWLEKGDNRRIYKKALDREWVLGEIKELGAINTDRAVDAIFSSVGLIPPTRMRKRVLVRRWLTVAAAAAVLGGALGTWFALRWRADQTIRIARGTGDIRPGRPMAVLTLADGSTVGLDTNANRSLATQGTLRIVQQTGGRISYEGGGLGEDQKGDSGLRSMAINRITTPRGGTYQVTLPGGTRVWLNAASSISYPVAATGGTMMVKLDGEAYFEVAKNKNMPFIVEVAGKSKVEVLGTDFDIYAYGNETSIRTTLLQGQVRVVGTSDSVNLLPGEQAEEKRQAGSIRVARKVDTERVMAWKNGLFDFDGEALPVVMRQIERWYDITVQYKGPAPTIEFSGGMDRQVNLSVVLKFLDQMKIRYTMEGRTLTIFD